MFQQGIDMYEKRYYKIIPKNLDIYKKQEPPEHQIPEEFRKKVENLAFIVEDEPSEEVRRREDLGPHDTLFGLYTGIPLDERGSFYGTGIVMPDTITIYQNPIEEEANGDPALRRTIVFDTVWHEVGHYLGLDEEEIRAREAEKGIGHYH